MEKEKLKYQAREKQLLQQIIDLEHNETMVQKLNEVERQLKKLRI